MKLRHAMATLAATLLTTSPALAQSPAPIPGFQLERLDFNASGAGSLLVGTGEVPASGTLRVSVLAHHEQHPLTFSRSDIGGSVVINSRLTTHVLAAWSVTDHLELALQLPLVIHQDAVNLSHLGISSPSSSGLSTPEAHARLGLLQQREGSPLDLALELGTGLPLGSNQALARDDGFRFTPKLMAGDAFGWVRVGLEVGLLLQPNVVLSPQATVVRDEIGDELRCGASLSTTNSGLRGEIAVRGALPLVRSPASGEVLAGARYAVAQGWEVFALGGMGLGSNPGTPLFRAMAGVSFGGSVTQPAHVADCTRNGTCPVVEAPAPSVAPQPVLVASQPTVVASQPAEDDPDHDQVPTAVDNCPTVPGPVENHGCPGERQLVVITQRQLMILEKVYFKFNKAELVPRSFPLLNQVAQVLQEHPEITLISIDGHTDDVGSARYNEALSLARASSVRGYLVRHGVSGSRLATRGFGSNQPAVPNVDDKSRDANRRVEFNIVSIDHGQDGSSSATLSRR